MKASITLFAALISIGLPNASPIFAAGERHITLLATNDIHGGIEPTREKNGKKVGGLALWSSVVKATKRGLEEAHPGQAGVLVLDAGDQFQGTLISNYDEGQLVLAAMNQVGYDAMVPGNHDYDFGPIGWLVDQSSDPTKRREALERLVSQSHFPLLSANTFFKSSLLDKAGQPVAVEHQGCKPRTVGSAIDWSTARRPAFLTPYVVKTVADVRVALIGLDIASTASQTTADNVEDLCFANEYTTYSRLRKELAARADVFVLIIHNGDTNNEHALTKLVQKIARLPGGGVDAVISGHTHFTYNERISGVPVIQSGFGGMRFGRIDLVWNTTAGKLVKAKTKSSAGVKLYYDQCDVSANDFCRVLANGGIAYQGNPVTPDPVIEKMIAGARDTIRPLANRPVGHSDRDLTHNRISESPLADAVTDAFRAVSGAEIAFVNSSGLRAVLPAGDTTYEDLFRVIPFNNHGLVVGPMSSDTLLDLLRRSIQTCGSYGALMQSGLRVSFQRDCSKSGGMDQSASLIHVETVKGEVLYDKANGAAATRNFQVATLDFLAAGGSGYVAFKPIPLVRDLGILREVFAAEFFIRPAHWTGEMDARWREVRAP